MKILYINNLAFNKSSAEFYNTDRKISAVWEKMHCSYNAQRGTKFMLETIFAQDYEWKDHVFKC